MKGIVLAGGSGTRLHPLTKGVSKQLLAVYDKPMIYYPLSVLMHAGIREVLIISTPHDLPSFKNLLGDGSALGMTFEYAVQPNPDGLAQAFIIGEQFIGDDDVCLVLGDNIFQGHGLTSVLQDAVKQVTEDRISVVFGYRVQDPERYGVVSFNEKRQAISIEEKPQHPTSNYAVTGLYFYTNDVISIAKTLQPSERGELEITDLNQRYLENKKLNVVVLDRGFAWLDTGTHDSLLEASLYVSVMEKRQGLKVACLEEIAYRKGYITAAQLTALAKPLAKSGYGKYLMGLLGEEIMIIQQHT